MPTEVSDAMGTIEVFFTDSNRYYEIDEDGNVSEPQEVSTNNIAGGIVGCSSGEITNCFNTGTVTGNYNVRRNNRDNRNKR